MPQPMACQTKRPATQFLRQQQQTLLRGKERGLEEEEDEEGEVEVDEEEEVEEN